MRYSDITASRPIEKRLVLKKIKIRKYQGPLVREIKQRPQHPRPLGKPLPGDKNFGLELEIRFYKLEDSDETAEGEEAEILVVYDYIFTAIKQDLYKPFA